MDKTVFGKSFIDFIQRCDVLPLPSQNISDPRKVIRYLDSVIKDLNLGKSVYFSPPELEIINEMIQNLSEAKEEFSKGLDLN